MDITHTGQVQSEPYDIDDMTPDAEHEAPKWLALAIVGGLFLAVAAVIMVIAVMILG